LLRNLVPQITGQRNVSGTQKASSSQRRRPTELEKAHQYFHTAAENEAGVGMVNTQRAFIEDHFVVGTLWHPNFVR
jgi:hypothetical protein